MELNTGTPNTRAQKARKGTKEQKEQEADKGNKGRQGKESRTSNAGKPGNAGKTGRGKARPDECKQGRTRPYTLSLHDALPICRAQGHKGALGRAQADKRFLG